MMMLNRMYGERESKVKLTNSDPPGRMAVEPAYVCDNNHVLKWWC